MKVSRFNQIVDSRIEAITQTLKSKREEYAADNNVFSNFEKAESKSGKVREKVLKDYMLKHEVSVDDLIEKLEAAHKGKTLTAEEVEAIKPRIKEKIGDIINYYILLEAMLIEKTEQSCELPF